MNTILEKMPNVAPEGPLNTDRKGPLSIIGDPLGQVVEKGLSPIGHVVGQVGNPSGEALQNVEKQATEEVGYQDKTKIDDQGPGGESVGGKEQSGKNPLGL